MFWVPNSEDPTTETRSDARTAYYDPAANRTNLHLVTATKVDKVLFQGTTAIGIQMTGRNDNTTVSAYARHEVVVAAGPLFSANVLQLSGVGPGSMLEAAGIDVVVDLPGVGMNCMFTKPDRLLTCTDGFVMGSSSRPPSSVRNSRLRTSVEVCLLTIADAGIWRGT